MLAIIGLCLHDVFLFGEFLFEFFFFKHGL